MYFSLENFYQSKAWRKLLASIKLERTNEDDEIICEYCGKPIVKAYDIIGHHKKELTDDNVNDFNVSLNPDNIALVHAKCHNYIHDKLGYSRRQVFIVYGSPLSGKSTYVKNSMNKGDLLIDIDEIWRAVSGCDLYVKPARLNAVVFKIRDTLLEAVKYRLGRWNNAYIIGGYPIASDLNRLSKELGARQIFIDTSKEECIQRLMESKDRDYVEWLKYIESWWNDYENYGTDSEDVPSPGQPEIGL